MFFSSICGVITGKILLNQVPVHSGNTAFVFWAIVLLAVVLFFYFLKRTDKLVAIRNEEKLKNAEPKSVKKQYDEPTEEIAVAIGLALSRYKVQYEEMENLRLTINKVSKQYSPWSSKIYSMRQLPR